jgi:hypothetical protein
MQKYLFVLVLSALFSTAALAQTGVADGSIRGVVKDPSGSAIAGASVTARNVDTGFERANTTGAEGGFEVPLLPPGHYEVTINAAGLRNSIRRALSFNWRKRAVWT